MMNTAELTDLELQIDSLLDSLSNLKADNQALRNQIASISQERARLRAKNHNAATKIRQIISQLKESLS